MRVWDVTPTPESGIVLPGRHQAEIRSVAFSPDGQRLATAAWDDTVRIWNVRSLKDTALLRHPGLNVESAIFSPDGRLVLTIAGDAVARVWDARAATEVPALTSRRSVRFAAFAAGGRRIVTVNADGVVRERDVSSGAEVSSHRVQEHRKSDGYFGTFRGAFAISADGRRLVVEWSDAIIGIWDLASRRIISVLERAAVYRARFSPDGRRLVTTDGSGDGVASVRDTISGYKLPVLRQQRDVRSAAFSPDGRTVVTAADGGEIHLWDADSGRELKVLGVHPDAGAVAFSPDARSVATAANDIRIWSVMPRGQALIAFGCAEVPWPLSAAQRERFGVTTEWCTPQVSAALRRNLLVRRWYRSLKRRRRGGRQARNRSPLFYSRIRAMIQERPGAGQRPESGEKPSRYTPSRWI